MIRPDPRNARSNDGSTHVHIDLPSKDETDYLVRCPSCGGYFDMREADQVYDQLGPLPHPATDQLQ
jgi:hypothetical protein